MTKLSYLNITANGDRIVTNSWVEAQAVQAQKGGHYTATYEPIYHVSNVKTAVIKNRPTI